MKPIYIANNFTLSSHDYSVSIIYDGDIYSIELDKYLGVKCFDGKLKYYNKYRLYKIILDILKDFIGEEKVDNITPIYNINYFGEKPDFGDFRNHFIQNHHYLHACSAYYPSPYEESAVLIIDDCGAAGEDSSESQTMRYGKGIDLEQIYTNIGDSVAAVSGIGRAYTVYSEFMCLEEGSIMGLSSYGDRELYDEIKIFNINGDYIKFDEKMDLHKLYDINENDFLQKDLDITKSKFAHIAAHLQSQVEEAIVYLAKILYEKTKSKNLCLAGGVALNILANTRILEQTPFENIFVQPATNDGGLSLGGAYYAYHVLGKNNTRIRIKSAGLGKSYNDIEIKNTLNKYSTFLEYSEIKDIEKQTAMLLNDGKIIGWFQGRNEYGPRALGFRSILASPKSVKIRDKVNSIKNRQSWRPLAPVILEENIGEYFSLNIKSPYMTFSSFVLEDKQKEIEGVVHIDESARFQSVNKNQNPKYYNLLKEFYNISNTPVLINTSFNVSGQTIVYKIEDAIETFLSTDLDYLIVENFLVSKNQVYKQFSFLKKDYIIHETNKKDYDLYMKNWNYLKKILSRPYKDIQFCYGDNENEYSYTTNKFCFKVDDSTKIILEKINYNRGYFKIINEILIKIDSNNNDLTDSQIQSLQGLHEIVLIIEKYYNNIKILFGIKD